MYSVCMCSVKPCFCVFTGGDSCSFISGCGETPVLVNQSCGLLSQCSTTSEYLNNIHT